MPRQTVPPACCRISSAARSAAGFTSLGVDALAEADAGLARQIERLHRPADADEIEVGRLQQDVLVASVTFVSAPPMTPARAIGPASSAMTSLSVQRQLAALLPSSVVSISPARAGGR